MGKINIYFDSIKRIFTAASALVMLTSCGTKIEPNYKILDNNNSVNDEIEPEVIEDQVEPEEMKIDYNMLINDLYNYSLLIDDTIDKNDFIIALLLLNQEYINDSNNEELKIKMNNYFNECEEFNSYEDASKLNKLLVTIREYNNSNMNSNYSFNNLLFMDLVPKTDSKVLNTIEKYYLVLKKYYLNDKSIDKDKIDKIYNRVNNFYMEDGKIDDTSYDELSDGTKYILQNLMYEIFTMLKDEIPKEEYEKFNKKINSDNSIKDLIESWSKNESKAVIEKDTEIKELCNYIYLMREELVDAAYEQNIIDDQLSSLFAIANIDYFCKNENNYVIFKELYGEDFDLEENYNVASDTVRRNYENIDIMGSFDFSKLFINSKKDKFVVKGIKDVINDLGSDDRNKVGEALQFLYDFSLYNGYATIEAYDSKNDETLYLDKSSLSNGGVQVVDWMIYYALDKYKFNIGNDFVIENIQNNVGKKYGEDGSIINYVEYDIYAEMEKMYVDVSSDSNSKKYDFSFKKTEKKSKTKKKEK